MDFGNTLIRKAKLDDVAQVFEIQENLGLSYWSIEDYQAEVSNLDSIFLVATIENKVVGFILVRLITLISVSEISNFGIKEKYQKSGIGKRLLDQIITELKPLQIKKIELEVREQNLQAIKFYLKNNFTKD